MPSIETTPFRSTPFTGDPNLQTPVIPDQLFHATDTKISYIAESLTLGGLVAYGGGTSYSGGGIGSSSTVGGVSPIGAVVPSSTGEIYIWVNPPSSGYEKQVYYISTGLTNSSWQSFGGTPVIARNVVQPSISLPTSDFIGQVIYFLETSASTPSYTEGYIATSIGNSSSAWLRIH